MRRIIAGIAEVRDNGEHIELIYNGSAGTSCFSLRASEATDLIDALAKFLVLKDKDNGNT